MTTRKAVVLLSGGLDSATALAVARTEGFECFALSISYGQRHESELNAAAAVAMRLGAKEHRFMRVDLAGVGGSALTDHTIEVPEEPTDGIPITYVPARNTIMLSLALAWAEVLGAEAIFVGVNARDYSVGQDTKVWVRSRSGSRLMRIADFCAMPDDEYETIAVNPQTLELEWRRVLGRHTHRLAGKRCFRIGVERGQRIEVSEDHSLFTIDPRGKITPIRGADLSIGTPLVLPYELSQFSDSWGAGLSHIDLADPHAMRAAGQKTSCIVEDGHLTNRLHRTRVPLHLPVTTELLRVVGLWLAEGGKDPSSESRSLAFSIGGLSGAPALLDQYFGQYGIGVHKSPANDYDYRVDSSVAYEVFRQLDLFGTAKAGTKRFPAWFWRLSQEQRRIVVAGLWDGDGCTMWRGEAAIHQKSHALIEDLYHCLLLDGIFATVKRGAHDQLRLAITRTTDIARFSNLYPLWHPEKKSSLERAARRSGRDKATGLWKFDGIWDTVSRSALPPGSKTRVYNAGGKYDTSVRAQRSAFEQVPGLELLARCKLAFLRVTSIEPVEHDVMYDLSVEHSENFLADGFLAHNSGYPDCRPEFVKAFNQLARLATKAGVQGFTPQVRAPLINLSKAAIIELGTKLGVDYSLTVSCYQADERGRACKRCDSCRIRRAGFAEAGIADPTRYAD